VALSAVVRRRAQSPGDPVILGVGCTALAHTLFIGGLGQMSAQLASLFVGLEPVWGIVLGLLILGEAPTPRSMAGGAIIVGATLVPAAFATGRLRPRPSPRPCGSSTGGSPV
jgi:threonine/homoserine efflux transporter RhtA